MKAGTVRKTLRGIGVGIMLSMLGMEVFAAEQPENGVYTLVNAANPELVAGVTGGYWDDATELLCLYNEDTNYEKFQITESVGLYKIQAAHSEKYIQTMDEGGAGNILRQYTDLLETGNQKWEFINVGEGTYQIKSANGFCIGVEGEIAEHGVRLVLVTPDEADDTQLWKLVPTEINPDEITLPVAEGDYVEMPEGVYEISSVLNGTSCWSVSEDETLEVPLTIIWDRVNDDIQKFEVKKVMEAKNTGDALYAISPFGSDKVLQKNYNNMIEIVDFVEDNGSQLWQFVYGGYGRYLIRCVDGIFATCQGGVTDNGVGIVMQDYAAVENSDYLKWFMTLCK